MTAEACAVGGFDWLLVDLEHGAGDEKDMAGQVRAAAVHGAPIHIGLPELIGIQDLAKPDYAKIADELSQIRKMLSSLLRKINVDRKG